MARELGQEVRIRITYAAIAGVAGCCALLGLATQSYAAAIIFGIFCVACTFMATSTRWCSRAPTPR